VRLSRFPLAKSYASLSFGLQGSDPVHAIPYYALKKGLSTMEKKGKKSVFNGRIMEIEGLPDLKCEQAFELTDASAKRSTAGCTIKLNPEPIKEYLKSNIVLLKWMIAEGYSDARTLSRRVAKMEAWLEHTECSPRVESSLEC
jgi:aconitate hydratase 2/2-methylisocitrate dehydratase